MRAKTTVGKSLAQAQRLSLMSRDASVIARREWPAPPDAFAPAKPTAGAATVLGIWDSLKQRRGPVPNDDYDVPFRFVKMSFNQIMIPKLVEKIPGRRR